MAAEDKLPPFIKPGQRIALQNSTPACQSEDDLNRILSLIDQKDSVAATAFTVRKPATGAFMAIWSAFALHLRQVFGDVQSYGGTSASRIPLFVPHVLN